MNNANNIDSWVLGGAVLLMVGIALWADNNNCFVRRRCPHCQHQLAYAADHHHPVPLADLGNPLYNVREATKNIVCLEKHLENPDERCVDCISKHFLLIEGLLEEAVGLDTHHRYVALLSDKPYRLRAVARKFVDTNNYLQTAQELRELRKYLVAASFPYFST
jgi:hypothetical protein